MSAEPITAQRIHNLRMSLGESPEQFGKRFGVARTTILHWEKKGPPQTGAGRPHVEAVMAELEPFERESVR